GASVPKRKVFSPRFAAVSEAAERLPRQRSKRSARPGPSDLSAWFRRCPLRRLPRRSHRRFVCSVRVFSCQTSVHSAGLRTSGETSRRFWNRREIERKKENTRSVCRARGLSAK
ncbi:unnamed protein product, partial [Ixodes pacificus]